MAGTPKAGLPHRRSRMANRLAGKLPTAAETLSCQATEIGSAPVGRLSILFRGIGCSIHHVSHGSEKLRFCICSRLPA